MRALFVAFPSPSHFFPLVPLAWALRADGHEVMVASSPSFVERVSHAGLPAVPAGETVEIGAIWSGFGVGSAVEAGDRAQQRAERAMAMFAAVAEAMADDLIAFARRWRPDVVVYEPRAYAALVVGAALDIPVVRHLWGTDFTYSRWDIERAALDPLWTKYDIAAVDPLGRLTVDPCPPSMQVDSVARPLLMRYVTYNGSGVVPGWVHDQPARPRVCVTWGTTFAATAGHLSPAQLALAAVTGLDVEVVVALSAAQRHLLTEAADNVRVVESLPLHLLLPSCAAIVHQGGAGTTLTSAASGLPQLVVPTIADEPLNGRQIAAVGAGLCLPGGEADVVGVRAAITALIEEPAYRQAATELRAEILRQPTPAEVAAALTTSAELARS